MLTCLVVYKTKVFENENPATILLTCLFGFIFLPVSTIVYVKERIWGKKE